MWPCMAVGDGYHLFTLDCMGCFLSADTFYVGYLNKILYLVSEVKG